MTSRVLDPVRDAVRDYLERTGTTEADFGRDAAGSADFCERLFGGDASFQSRTLDKVMAFIESNPPDQRPPPEELRRPRPRDGTIGEFDYDRRMEIYKVMVDSAERGIDRRHALNRFYFSVVVAIFISISFVLQSDNADFPTRTIVSSALLLGFLNCVLWLSTIFAARRLNASKYDTIGELETYLDYAPFTREWEIHVAKGRNFPRFTLIEQALPAALAMICLVLFGLISVGIVTI